MVMNLQDRGVLPEEMRYTYSVCPVCLKRIPAKREERDGQIYLVKTWPGARDIFQCNLEK